MELVVVPAVVGAITGVLVGLLVDVVERFLLETVILGIPGPWFAIPALGVFVLTRLALVKVAGATSPSTSELFPEAYHHGKWRYPLRQVPGRILSGVTTVGLGGSQGLESQSAMVGSTVGIAIRRVFGDRLPYLSTQAGRRLVLVCGASAGIATVFSSPILGAAYGIEMPFRRRLDGRRLLPSMIAASVSYVTASLIKSSRSLMTYVPHDISAREMAGALGVALLCGVGARYFAVIMGHIRRWKDGPRPWLRAAGAGVALMLLAMAGWFVTGQPISAGPGYVASDWALPASGPGPTVWLLVAALAFRWLTVLLCIGAGGGGGVFTSLATNGLLIGTAVAVAMDLPNPTLLALVGMGAFLGAGYRIPLAGAGLIIMMCGEALPAAVGIAGVAIATVIMGSLSASDAQTDDAQHDDEGVDAIPPRR